MSYDRNGHMDNLGVCSECGKQGFYNMTIPNVGFVVVCKRCEYTLGNKNLIAAGYRKLSNGTWKPPPR